jgi:hypothetical protein
VARETSEIEFFEEMRFFRGDWAKIIREGSKGRELEMRVGHG